MQREKLHLVGMVSEGEYFMPRRRLLRGPSHIYRSTTRTHLLGIHLHTTTSHLVLGPLDHLNISEGFVGLYVL